jgi:acyl-CoA synthetase (AMP-forming)/AMP-acid ligase II
MDTAYPLRVAASKFRRRDALVYRGNRLTFGELDEHVDRLARGLTDAGLRGKAIASVLHNDPRTICLYLAAARAGAVTVPINNRLTASEIAFIAKDSGAELLVIDQEILDTVPGLPGMLPVGLRSITLSSDYDSAIEDYGGLLGPTTPGEFFADVDDASAATIIYTSGTSGFPKGVVRSHSANLWAVANSLIGSPRSPDGDVELFALPMFGVGFIYQVMPTLMSGGTVILDRSFEPQRTWQILAEESVTRCFLAPTMIAALLDVDGNDMFDVSPLQTILVAYEFSARLRQRALERFGDVFINMYGLTEAQLCAGAPGDFRIDPSAAGRPMGMARVLILDQERRPLPVGEVGEIAFETPAAMTEYKGLAEETRRVIHGSLVLTGDLGYLDEDGSLHFAGRSKEIIKSGGFSIDPVEIENVIHELDFVVEAAVVGLKDERWGERVVAFVVIEDEVADSEIVRQHCRSRLAAFKVPKEVRFLTGLPKNATGKIQRAQLRATSAHQATVPD